MVGKLLPGSGEISVMHQVQLAEIVKNNLMFVMSAENGTKHCKTLPNWSKASLAQLVGQIDVKVTIVLHIVIKS